MKAKKIIGKFFKILLFTVLSLIFLVLVVAGIAFQSENTITGMALEEVEQMFDAPVKVENIELLLFRNFPYATVELSGVSLGTTKKDSAHFESDTLLNLRKLYVSIKTKPLLSNKIEIHKIEIEGFAFNYFVDSAGKGNIDFLTATDTTAVVEEDTTVVADTASSVLDMLLQNLTIRDVTVKYADATMGAAVKVHIPEMDIQGRVLNEYYKGALKGKVELSDVKFESTNAHLMNQTSLSFNLDYDDGKVKIEAIDFITDGAKLFVNGDAKLGDSIFVNMQVNLEDVDIKELSKYAPQEILDEFGVESAEGLISIQTNVNGYYYDTLLLPKIETNIAFSDFKVKTQDYPELTHLSIKGKVEVPNANDMSTMSAHFSSISIGTPKSSIDLAAKVTNFEKPQYNIQTRADITLDEFSNFLPKEDIKYLEGRVKFNFSSHGTLTADLGMNSADYFMARTNIGLEFINISTAMDSTMEFKNFNAKFAYKPSKRIELKDLSVEAPGFNVNVNNFTFMADILGKVRDMNNMGMDIDSLYLDLGETKLALKGKLKGLEKPNFDIATNLAVNIDQWLSYIPKEDVEHITGKIDLALKTHGTIDLDSIETQMMPIVFEQTELKLKVRDFEFAMPNDTLSKVDKLNLDFAMANDTMRLDNFHASMLGIDVWVDSTTIWNAYKAVLQENKAHTLIVNAYIKASEFDYAKFAPIIEGDTTETESAAINQEQLMLASNTTHGPAPAQLTNQAPEEEMIDTTSEDSFMPSYIVRGTFGMQKAVYDGMVFEDISTKFRVDDSLYVIDQFKLKAFDGEINTSAVYDTRQDTQIIISFKNIINGLDIHRLLVEGKNFGQEEFTSDNITGILTSDVDGRIVFTDSFDVVFNKMVLKGDFKLQNGAIYNYEPLSELSKMPIPGLKDLDSLIFQTLNSQVFIYKNNIYFPKTDIITNATDISAYGMQSFDEDYEYHLKLFLRDIFFSKNKKLLKEQGFNEEEGENKKGERKGLELVAKDIAGDTKYGADNTRLQRMMQTKIRLQNTGLSFIFNPRLVNFITDIDRKEGKAKKATDVK
jgi:hypothetical protein